MSSSEKIKRRKELEKFAEGRPALLKAVQGMTPLIKDNPKFRPTTIQFKANNDLRELVDELADDFGLDQSKLLRWLVYRFDLERRSEHGKA